MFDALYSLLAAPLNWLYSLTGNYVIALIIYAVLIKIVLFPFGIKQQKGMVKQAKMRPKEMAIRNRYAGRTDQKTQMKMQEELQSMYKEEGYSPLSGCGPMLIQLPIIFILYRIIYEPLKYVKGMSNGVIDAIVSKASELAGKENAFSDRNHIQFLEMIKDHFDDFKGIEGFVFEKAEDFAEFFRSFTIGGINLTKEPAAFLDQIKNGTVENWTEAIILIAIPVLVFLSQFISSKVVRKMSYQPMQDAQAAASMKIMDWMMPLMTLFLAFKFSGLLGIYWILNSLLSMVQQIILKKMFPIPVFTEEDYKAAEKAMNGKLKPVKKSGTKKKNPKSLHHIDDDDDEEQTPPASVPDPAPKKEKKAKGSKLIEPAKEKDSEDTATEQKDEKEGN